MTSSKTPSAFDWTGWYLGGQYGYATGYSRWNANQPGGAGPILTGSLNLTNPLNGYFGDGSYFGGLQAGYNQRIGKHLLLGAEADIWFPSFTTGLMGAQTFASSSWQDKPAIRIASPIRAHSGDVWAMSSIIIGCFTARPGSRSPMINCNARSSLARPRAAMRQAGTFQNGLMWRLGWALGAGLEVPIAPRWTGKVEYQYAKFDNNSIAFPAATQVFNSDLALQSVRVGFNYQIGDGSKWGDFVANGPPAIEQDRFALHGQVTYVQQYVPQFRSPYVGPQSLIPNQGRETADTTFYIGTRLWTGGEFWIDPEVDQGFGLSNTFGVAGFPSGEAYKVGSDYPTTRVPRALFRQTINLGGEGQKVEGGINQFAGTNAENRLVITLGKLSVSDIFDDNRYAHDPRNDFMNWALVDAATFDYAADAWGYTYGGAIEWYAGKWTLAVGLFDAPLFPNSTEVDPHFNQFQSLFEIAHRHELWGQPGEITITGWLTRARLENYNDAVALAQITGQPADIAAVRRYTSRSGIAANFEQQITADWGVFMRTGLCEFQCRAGCLHGCRSHCRWRCVVYWKAMGTAGRRLGSRRCSQQHFLESPSLFQQWWARHCHRGWSTAPPRPRANFGDLLHVPPLRVEGYV